MIHHQREVARALDRDSLILKKSKYPRLQRREYAFIATTILAVLAFVHAFQFYTGAPSRPQSPSMLCLHCRYREAGEARLCQPCRRMPDVAAQYPPRQKFAAGPAQTTATEEAEPTEFTPGSLEKIDVLAARVLAGQKLFHDGDAKPGRDSAMPAEDKASILRDPEFSKSLDGNGHRPRRHSARVCTFSGELFGRRRRDCVDFPPQHGGG